MPVRTALEMVTADRLVIERHMLAELVARGLARASGGRPLYVIARDARRGDMVLQALEPRDLAEPVAAEAMALAERFVLPVPLDADAQVPAMLRDCLARMPKITRPLAEQALREALAEIVKLRTALGLAEGQAET